MRRRVARLLSPCLGVLAAVAAVAAGTARAGGDDAAGLALRVGTSGDYAPFSLAPGPGAPPEGFDLAVARAYAEERGLALELVSFRWPELVTDLVEGRFDVAMSGVTVRPERSLAGRFSVPVVESGAVALAHHPERWKGVEDLNRAHIRIGVNEGGHLARVAERRFPRATLVFVAENAAVREALLSRSLDAAVTDTLEAPEWLRDTSGLAVLGPFTRDRKAYLVRADRPGLAADLDAWLLAREADGSLARLRARHLSGVPAAAVATPLGALFAALDERLALMPWVAAAKRAEARPIFDPEREELVVDAAAEALLAAARAAGDAPAPPEGAVRALFRAQIEAAKEVQWQSLRDSDYAPPAPVPDLESELRPALLRQGERIARLVLALPARLDPARVHAAARDGLRSPWLSGDSVRALADAVVALRAPT